MKTNKAKTQSHLRSLECTVSLTVAELTDLAELQERLETAHRLLKKLCKLKLDAVSGSYSVEVVQEVQSEAYEILRGVKK